MDFVKKYVCSQDFASDGRKYTAVKIESKSILLLSVRRAARKSIFWDFHRDSANSILRQQKLHTTLYVCLARFLIYFVIPLYVDHSRSYYVHVTNAELPLILPLSSDELYTPIVAALWIPQRECQHCAQHLLIMGVALLGCLPGL